MKFFVVQACLTWKGGTTIWGEWPINCKFALVLLTTLYFQWVSGEVVRPFVYWRLSRSMIVFIHDILSFMHHVQLTAGVKTRVNRSDACDEQLTAFVHVAFIL